MDSGVGLCWGCEGGGRLWCPNCRLALYCSVTCQKKDANRHLEECTGSSRGTITCGYCGRGETLGGVPCSACLLISYCSDSCRQMDTKAHREVCLQAKIKVVEAAKKISGWNRRAKGIPQYIGRLIHAVDYIRWSENEGARIEAAQQGQNKNTKQLLRNGKKARSKRHKDEPSDSEKKKKDDEGGVGGNEGRRIRGEEDPIVRKEEALRLLLLGADLKHVLTTLHNTPDHCTQSLEVTLLDSSPHILARDLLIVYLLLLPPDSTAPTALHQHAHKVVLVFYSVSLDMETHALLCNTLHNLLNLSHAAFLIETKGQVSVDASTYRLAQAVWSGWMSFANDPAALQKLEKVRTLKQSGRAVKEVLTRYIKSCPRQHQRAVSDWVKKGSLNQLQGGTFPNVTLACFSPLRGEHLDKFEDVAPKWSEESEWLRDVGVDDDMVYAPHGMDIIFQDWDFHTVMCNIKQEVGLLDMYRLYLTQVFVRARQQLLRSTRVSLNFVRAHVHELPTSPHLLKGKFDRIATGIYADLLGTPYVLQHLSGMLREDNMYARLITHHRVWSLCLDWRGDQQARDACQKSRKNHRAPDPLLLLTGRWATFRHFLQAELLYHLYQLDARPLHPDNVPVFRHVRRSYNMLLSDYTRQLNHIVPFRFQADKRTISMVDARLHTLEWRHFTRSRPASVPPAAHTSLSSSPSSEIDPAARYVDNLISHSQQSPLTSSTEPEPVIIDQDKIQNLVENQPKIEKRTSRFNIRPRPRSLYVSSHSKSPLLSPEFDFWERQDLIKEKPKKPNIRAYTEIPEGISRRIQQAFQSESKKEKAAAKSAPVTPEQPRKTKVVKEKASVFERGTAARSTFPETRKNLETVTPSTPVRKLISMFSRAFAPRDKDKESEVSRRYRRRHSLHESRFPLLDQSENMNFTNSLRINRGKNKPQKRGEIEESGFCTLPRRVRPHSVALSKFYVDDYDDEDTKTSTTDKQMKTEDTVQSPRKKSDHTSPLRNLISTVTLSSPSSSQQPSKSPLKDIITIKRDELKLVNLRPGSPRLPSPASPSPAIDNLPTIDWPECAPSPRIRCRQELSENSTSQIKTEGPQTLPKPQHTGSPRLHLKLNLTDSPITRLKPNRCDSPFNRRSVPNSPRKSPLHSPSMFGKAGNKKLVKLIPSEPQYEPPSLGVSPVVNVRPATPDLENETVQQHIEKGMKSLTPEGTTAELTTPSPTTNMKDVLDSIFSPRPSPDLGRRKILSHTKSDNDKSGESISCSGYATWGHSSTRSKIVVMEGKISPQKSSVQVHRAMDETNGRSKGKEMRRLITQDDSCIDTKSITKYDLAASSATPDKTSTLTTVDAPLSPDPSNMLSASSNLSKSQVSVTSSATDNVGILPVRITPINTSAPDATSPNVTTPINMPVSNTPPLKPPKPALPTSLSISETPSSSTISSHTSSTYRSKTNLKMPIMPCYQSTVSLISPSTPASLTSPCTPASFLSSTPISFPTPLTPSSHASPSSFASFTSPSTPTSLSSQSTSAFTASTPEYLPPTTFSNMTASLTDADMEVSALLAQEEKFCPIQITDESVGDEARFTRLSSRKIKPEYQISEDAQYDRHKNSQINEMTTSRPERDTLTVKPSIKSNSEDISKRESSPSIVRPRKQSVCKMVEHFAQRIQEHQKLQLPTLTRRDSRRTSWNPEEKETTLHPENRRASWNTENRRTIWNSESEQASWDTEDNNASNQEEIIKVSESPLPVSIELSSQVSENKLKQKEELKNDEKSESGISYPEPDEEEDIEYRYDPDSDGGGSLSPGEWWWEQQMTQPQRASPVPVNRMVEEFSMRIKAQSLPTSPKASRPNSIGTLIQQDFMKLYSVSHSHDSVGFSSSKASECDYQEAIFELSDDEEHNRESGKGDLNPENVVDQIEVAEKEYEGEKGRVVGIEDERKRQNESEEESMCVSEDEGDCIAVEKITWRKESNNEEEVGITGETEGLSLCIKSEEETKEDIISEQEKELMVASVDMTNEEIEGDGKTKMSMKSDDESDASVTNKEEDGYSIKYEEEVEARDESIGEDSESSETSEHGAKSEGEAAEKDETSEHCAKTEGEAAEKDKGMKKRKTSLLRLQFLQIVRGAGGEANTGLVKNEEAEDDNDQVIETETCQDSLDTGRSEINEEQEEIDNGECEIPEGGCRYDDMSMVQYTVQVDTLATDEGALSLLATREGSGTQEDTHELWVTPQTSSPTDSRGSSPTQQAQQDGVSPRLRFNRTGGLDRIAFRRLVKAGTEHEERSISPVVEYMSSIEMSIDNIEESGPVEEAVDALSFLDNDTPSTVSLEDSDEVLRAYSVASEEIDTGIGRQKLSSVNCASQKEEDKIKSSDQVVAPQLLAQRLAQHIAKYPPAPSPTPSDTPTPAIRYPWGTLTRRRQQSPNPSTPPRNPPGSPLIRTDRLSGEWRGKEDGAAVNSEGDNGGGAMATVVGVVPKVRATTRPMLPHRPVPRRRSPLPRDSGSENLSLNLLKLIDPGESPIHEISAQTEGQVGIEAWLEVSASPSSFYSQDIDNETNVTDEAEVFGEVGGDGREWRESERSEVRPRAGVLKKTRDHSRESRRSLRVSWGDLPERQASPSPSPPPQQPETSNNQEEKGYRVTTL